MDIEQSAQVVVRGGGKSGTWELVVELNIDFAIASSMLLGQANRMAKLLVHEATLVGQMLLTRPPFSKGPKFRVSEVEVVSKDRHLRLSVEVIVPRSQNDTKSATAYQTVTSVAGACARSRDFKVV